MKCTTSNTTIGAIIIALVARVMRSYIMIKVKQRVNHITTMHVPANVVNERLSAKFCLCVVSPPLMRYKFCFRNKCFLSFDRVIA